MVPEPLVLQEYDVVTEAADDDPNILTLRVLVLVTCIAAGNYGQRCIFHYCYGYGFLNEFIMIKGVFYCCNQLTTMEYPHRKFFLFFSPKIPGDLDRNGEGVDR